ncbi:hypothetical protein HDU82_007791 [Entophlyctis luteolus]|nr:hypothetical protein HDU82_007791 [Entophlyctis luteolus]
MTGAFKILQTSGTLYVEVDDSLQQIVDLAKPLCNNTIPISLVFVATSVKAAQSLDDFGIPPNAIALSNPIGHLSNLDLTNSAMGSLFAEIFPTETMLFNPWLPVSARSRGRKSISRPASSKNFESFAISVALVISGISDIVTFGTFEGIQNLPFLGSSPSSSGIDSQTTFNPSESTTQIYYSIDISFAVKWGIACGVPTAIALVVGIIAFVNAYVASKKKEQKELEMKRKVLEAHWRDQQFNIAELPDYQREVDNTLKPDSEVNASKDFPIYFAEIAEYIAITGWFLYALGIGLSEDIQTPTLGFFMYIFGITGIGSCVLSMILMKGTAIKATVVLFAVINTLAILGGQ